MDVNSDILTFSERADVAVELLAIGRKLADTSGRRVVSLLIGQDGPARAREAITQGADEVLLPSGQPHVPATPCVLVDVLAQVVHAAQPSIVLIGSTRIGAEVATSLAQRLGVASASDCLALDLDEVGDLVVERFVHGGRFVARCVLHSAPKIAAVQVRRFEPLPPAERCGEVRELPVLLPAPTVTVVDVNEPEHSQVDIGKAPVVATAGRGVRSREDLALLESLARAFGGEVAGSRPLVDMHWLAPDQLVGLSGRTVKPELYLACGVSGQIEHIAGMRSSRTVVAINTDPDAPIHREADYSIVDDLYQVIPALVAAMAEARAESTGRAPAGAGECLETEG